MKKFSLIAIGMAVGLSLAGCYESTEVTVYEPGQYKGAKDPLLKGANRTETLQKRFSMIQTDR